MKAKLYRLTFFRLTDFFFNRLYFAYFLLPIKFPKSCLSTHPAVTEQHYLSFSVVFVVFTLFVLLVSVCWHSNVWICISRPHFFVRESVWKQQLFGCRRKTVEFYHLICLFTFTSQHFCHCLSVSFLQTTRGSSVRIMGHVRRVFPTSWQRSVAHSQQPSLKSHLSSVFPPTEWMWSITAVLCITSEVHDVFNIWSPRQPSACFLFLLMVL